MVRLSLRFDLRVPPGAATSFAAQHAAMLELAEWGERVGVATLSLSEHHGDPAGFMSAPCVLAAAVLARTRRLRVSLAALLAPLHDPVRLAEQLATLDCLGPGRLSVVLGAGYRRAELAMAGVASHERGARVEDCVRVLRAAWTGRPFAWRGREILATPPPATPGGPELLLGGKSVASARRAARLRCGFSPAVGALEVIAAYFEESARVGFEGAEVFGCRSLGEYRRRHPADAPPSPGFVMLSRDPDATWRRLGPQLEADARSYAAWQADGVVSDWAVPGAESWQALRASGRYAIVTPEACVALARRDGHLMLHPLAAGIEPASARESLRLLEEEVLPTLGGTAAP